MPYEPTHTRVWPYPHTRHTPILPRTAGIEMSVQPKETHSQGLGSGLTFALAAQFNTVDPTLRVFLPSHGLPSPAGDLKCSIQSSLLSCPLGDLSHSQSVQSILCIEDSQTHTQADQTPPGRACVSDGSTQILMDLSNQPPEMELEFPTSCSPA